MTVSLKDLAIRLLRLAVKSRKAIQWQSEAAGLLEKSRSHTRADAEIFIEKKARAIRLILEKEISRQRDTPRDWGVQLSDGDDRILIPKATVVSKEERIKKEILSLLRTGDWKQFENACKAILKIARFTMYDVGARSQEGGLDFFGVYHFATFIPASAPLHKWRGRVFGQAKKYGKRPMSDTEVHTVLSQVTEFNVRKGRAYEKSPRWFRDDGSPVQIVLASFSGFSADAVKLGDRHGAIYWDADRIANFMAQAVLETALTVDKLKGWVTGKLPF